MGSAVPEIVPEISIAELLRRYELILLDAYGVLIEAERALPGARELIDHLEASRHRYFIVTNDASRSAESCAHRYRALGLAVPPEKVMTSGGLIARYFREHGLNGAPSVVLGPEDSRRYVEEAGGRLLPLPPLSREDEARVRAVIIGDESGYPFLESVDAALSLVFRKFDAGAPPALILPNPDLIYPQGEQRWGIASGNIALMIESALALRHPGHPQGKFSRLGKPHAPIFEEALLRAGTRNAVMIGDQLETDVRGAQAAGIDSALATFGVTREVGADAPVRPTYLLPSLRMS